jgi:hypothetical protein
MHTKQFGQVEIKSADKGEVSAVFSTFNVIDKDGDVTLPGAFTDGAEVVISSYGHTSWGGMLPVGTGTIRTTDTEAVLDGKFFLDTTAGKDTFQVVKQLAGRQQWSYGYDVDDSAPGVHEGQDVRLLKRMTVHEVSPVLVGAGVNTRTLATKGLVGSGKEGDAVNALYKAAIRPHTSEVTNRAWDGTAVVAAIADDASVSELRSVFAWVDAAGDPEAKTNYRFPHHHGAGGPANLRAVVAGIAVLNGARGGTTIPDADRQGVYNHLAGHLRDVDREPPELRSSDATLKNIDRLPGLLAELAEVVGSIREVGSSRATRGKSLSSLTFEVLGWAEEDLAAVLGDVRALKNTPRENLAAALIASVARRLRDFQRSHT